MRNTKAAELKQAREEVAYWEEIFLPLGCVLTGWTYRNHCQVRLPSGKYLSIGPAELELIECAKRAFTAGKQP
jgi:hypothetical protein